MPESPTKIQTRGSNQRFAESYQLSAVSCQPERAARVLSAAHSPQLTAHSSSAFTLIEMIVVVAIISLLLAISIPVSVGLVKNQQEEATKATLEVLKSAIDTYHLRRPGQNLGGIFPNRYSELFGRFPPSPTAALQITGSPIPTEWQASPPEHPGTVLKFVGNGSGSPGLLQAYLGAQLMVHAGNNAFYYPQGTSRAAAEKFPTIECLLIFLRTYSPEARAMIDRLGKALTNEDGDCIDRNGDRIADDELFEVRDAWGEAIQYNFVASPIVGGWVYKWELRSAGQNKVFMPAFSDPDAGDDVVVSGSARSE